MILVDTSVWIDHLRSGDDALAGLLEGQEVLIHPFVLGELALGALRQRSLILETLRLLPQAPRASDEEVLAFIDARALHGSGIGYVDAQLLASVHLAPGTLLWTRDRRLAEVARSLGVCRS